MIRTTKITAIIVLAWINLGAQQLELPQFVPASPEASLFLKSGVANVNLSTGAATANIPLYTIKIKNYAFPISVSYSTQGLKADEASSRVGYGWILNANGVITRSVKGAPDELAARLPVPVDFNAITDALFLYYQQASSSGTGSGFDSQPDEYQFHCNGYTGKFVLDSNNVPRITSTSNVKIVLSGDLILLTTPDGVQYRFGSALERTSNHSYGNLTYYKVLKTAYFLDRIDLPTGENIIFHYTAITTYNTTGITQTAQVVQSVNGEVVSCPTPNMNSYTTTTNNVTYNTQILNSITTSTGLTINLVYENRPDGSGDFRLDSLNVSGLRKYAFEYYNVANPGNQPTGRFFLTKVRDLGSSGDQILDYTMGYEQLTGVPLPITFCQDYLGFYNRLFSSCLIPDNILAGQTVDFSYRNPSSGFSKLGTLTSIQYPTGGQEDYVYEANTTNQAIQRNTMATYPPLEGLGGGSAQNQTYQSISYTLDNVTVPFDQTVTLYARADPSGNDMQAAGHHTLSVALNGTNVSITGFNSNSWSVSLQAGQVYQLTLTVEDYTIFGTCSITYNTSDHPIYDYVNVEAPGVRLRQIKYTDPFTSLTHSKYYTYASLGSTSQSSGSLQVIGPITGALVSIYCNQGATVGETDVQLTTYSSSALGQTYGYASSGSPMYYKTVIESDDPDFKNGGTEYTFFDNDNGLNQNLVHGNDIPYIPGGQYPTLSGVVQQARVFDSGFNTVKSESNVYETLIYTTNMVTSVYVRKNWDPSTLSPAFPLERMAAFDAVRIDYSNYWIRLKTKIETNEYGLTKQTDYVYGTPSNILPASVTTTDSKGNTVTTMMMYPNTYDGSNPVAAAGYSLLQAKNIITPVVVQSSYSNGVLEQQKRTFYIDWFGNLSIVEPQTIQVKASPYDALHDGLIFSSYSTNGNPLQLQKVNDIPISYLWDEALSLPIAEIKNAKAGTAAYTSFENNAYGGWAPTGTETKLHRFTGEKSFSGTLTKTVSVSGTYTVSLWTTATTSTVNGSGGTLIKTANGWNLYQWTLINPSTVTVSGTTIDEVRLWPADALMQTFTYKPFQGVTTTADNNNNVIFYTYDAFGDLSQMMDIDGNILKTIDYHYQQN